MGTLPALKTIDDNHPKYSQILKYVKKGHSYYDDEMFIQALRMYIRAIKIHDRNAELWCYVGLAYAGMKQYNHAIESFQHAIALDRNYVDSYWYAAEVLHEDGQKESAVCLLNIYIDLETNEKRIEEALAWKNSLISDLETDEFTLCFDLDYWINNAKRNNIETHSTQSRQSGNTKPSVVQQSASNNNRDLCVDHDEYEVCRLGTGWIESYVMSGAIERSVLVVTNKRLYQQGRAFDKDNKGYHSVTSKRVIEIDAVSGSSVIMNNPVTLIGVAFMLLFLGILLAITIGGAAGGGIAGGSISLSIVLFVIYAVNRRQYLIIHFKGGEIILNSSWYSYKSIDDFQMELSKAIQKHIQDSALSATRNE